MDGDDLPFGRPAEDLLEPFPLRGALFQPRIRFIPGGIAIVADPVVSVDDHETGRTIVEGVVKFLLALYVKGVGEVFLEVLSEIFIIRPQFFLEGFLTVAACGVFLAIARIPLMVAQGCQDGQGAEELRLRPCRLK